MPAAVRWSGDTQDALPGLVVKQARDAVATFLDRDYVRAKLAEIARQAGWPIWDPQATLEHVGKALRFTAEQQATILAHFVQGTSGGCCTRSAPPRRPWRTPTRSQSSLAGTPATHRPDERVMLACRELIEPAHSPSC